MWSFMKAVRNHVTLYQSVVHNSASLQILAEWLTTKQEIISVQRYCRTITLRFSIASSKYSNR